MAIIEHTLERSCFYNVLPAVSNPRPLQSIDGPRRHVSSPWHTARRCSNARITLRHDIPMTSKVHDAPTYTCLEVSL